MKINSAGGNVKDVEKEPIPQKSTTRNLILLICFDCLLVSMTIFFAMLYRSFGQAWMLSSYVTFLTVTYHFVMRLMVGQTVSMIYKNREFRMDSLGFRMHSFEPELYRKLKVKKWKANMITAKPEQFDLKKNNLESLLHNMAQAEFVHRVIMVLSFLPLLLIIPYGAPVVFFVTSVLACLIDLQFVIIQRYNRPRVERLVEMTKKRKNNNSFSTDV